MKRIVFSIMLLLAGYVYAGAQAGAFEKTLAGILSAGQKNTGVSAGSPQYSRPQNEDKKDYLANFSIGEQFMKEGKYALACTFYMKASKIMQNTTDAGLRQLGVSGYNEMLDNNMTYCMVQFRYLHPDKYLEADSRGDFWEKSLYPSTSDCSDASQTSYQSYSQPSSQSYSQPTSQPSSQTLSAEDYARVLSALNDIDATIRTTPSTPAPPKQPRKCGTCRGDGMHHSCNGSGKTRLFNSLRLTTCKECHGTGRCPTCGGAGHYSN